MPQIKLALDTLSVPVKIQKSRQIVAALTGNANFSAVPAPNLSALTAATNALETAANDAAAADNAAVAKHTTQNTRERELDGLLTQMGNLIENLSGGDAAKIQSAGMDVRAAAAPLGDLGRIQNLQASVGDNDGEVDLDWDNLRGASAYQIEMASSGDGPWQLIQTAVKSKASVPNLTSGTKYWFHVAAVGASGTGPWSAPAGKVAP